MKNIINLILVCLIAVGISGCAIGMALRGKEEVNLAALHVGQSRSEVIMVAGQPIQTMVIEEGRKDIFKCQLGNAPSAGRAAGHAIMDTFTLGAWELIGTPIEAFRGSKFYLTITYDKEDKVTNIETSQKKVSLN